MTSADQRSTVQRRDSTIAARWFTEPRRLRISTEHDRNNTRWCSEYTVGALVEHFGDHGPRSILDIGCGSGDLLALLHVRFPLAALAGIDPHHGSAAAARSLVPHAHICCSAAEDLPLASVGHRRFDAVVVQLNLALWDDPHRGLVNATGLLSDGGLCYVVDPVTETRPPRVPESGNRRLDVDDYLSDQLAASFTLAEAAVLAAQVTDEVDGITSTVAAGGVLGRPQGSAAATRIWQHNNHVRTALLASERSSDADLLYMNFCQSPDAPDRAPHRSSLPTSAAE